MHPVLRFAFAFSLTLSLAFFAGAKTPDKESEYRRDGQNVYPKTDVLKLDPNAVILPASEARMMSGQAGTQPSYFLPAHHHPAKVVYLQQAADWIEPITPPSMPASLNIPLDAMQVREPHGDVEVALPSAPASFNPVTDGMTLPNGSVLKTGGSGTVAVLFGGVDSVRLAPDTQAAVQLAVTPTLRDAEVDLHSGVAFSKVGLRLGEKEDYQVHTSFGVVSAHGTDFATVALPERVDVWVALGTVQLISPDGNGAKNQSVTTDAKGPFKVMRYPLAKDAPTALQESSETLSSALSIIPMVNQKLKVLTDRVAAGGKLTTRETDYLSRIRKVSSLIKLTLVPPPAPPPKPKPAPVVKKENKPASLATPITTPTVKATPADTPSTPYTDPNSLGPQKAVSKTPPAASTSGDNVPSVRASPTPLNLRDQDNSAGKPIATGPNVTVP